MRLRHSPTLLRIFLEASMVTSHRALAKATLPEGSDILNFYYLADREGWMEEQGEEAERQYGYEIKTKEEKNELARDMIDDGHNGWTDENFRKASLAEKEKAIKGFYVSRWIYQQEEEADSTEVFFEKASILSNPTLIRFTDHVTPEEATAPGFRFDGHEPENMGLTAGGGWNDRLPDEDGNLAFAFDAKDMKTASDWGHGTHYGKNAYTFKVPYAVKVWHISDNEWQVVFDVNTVKDLKPINMQDALGKSAPKIKPMKKGEKIPF